MHVDAFVSYHWVGFAHKHSFGPISHASAEDVGVRILLSFRTVASEAEMSRSTDKGLRLTGQP